LGFGSADEVEKTATNWLWILNVDVLNCWIVWICWTLLLYNKFCKIILFTVSRFTVFFIVLPLLLITAIFRFLVFTVTVIFLKKNGDDPGHHHAKKKWQWLDNCQWQGLCQVTIFQWQWKTYLSSHCHCHLKKILSRHPCGIPI
jgi:hypothetical protein